MARTVEQFPARPTRKKVVPEEWFDGAIREFVPGEDFTRKPEGFINELRDAAKARGGRMRTQQVKDVKGNTTSVFAQFTPASERIAA